MNELADPTEAPVVGTGRVGAELITRNAREHQADLIVVGHKATSSTTTYSAQSPTASPTTPTAPS
jgi:nucleotide-binding universal stress UspA family protein